MQDHRHTFKRLQHPGFGTEVREVLRSDPPLSSVVVAELDGLLTCLREGRVHPREGHLNGHNVGTVRYIRVYREGYSARVYFTIAGGNVWLIGLDANKRRSGMTKGMEETLGNRLAWVLSRVKAQAVPA